MNKNDQDQASNPHPRNDYHFFTVDAETAVITSGMERISRIREEVEKEANIRVPIVWFIRFQRAWEEYVTNDNPRYFESRMTTRFDGFELARHLLIDFRKRGDEIGWHYHAYNYVHRDDLSHDTRMKILRADLISCKTELVLKHPDFPVRSFRFGWFFVPDYTIFETLKTLGIRYDASVRASKVGENVKEFAEKYLPAITAVPKTVDGTSFFPFEQTTLVHDWNVVAHDYGWSRLDEEGARRNQEGLRRDLLATARRLQEEQGGFLTYQGFPGPLPGDS